MLNGMATQQHGGGGEEGDLIKTLHDFYSVLCVNEMSYRDAMMLIDRVRGFVLADEECNDDC